MVGLWNDRTDKVVIWYQCQNSMSWSEYSWIKLWFDISVRVLCVEVFMGKAVIWYHCQNSLSWNFHVKIHCHVTDEQFCRVNQNGAFPCFTGVEGECFTAEQRCNKVLDCKTDGADEWGCKLFCSNILYFLSLFSNKSYSLLSCCILNVFFLNFFIFWIFIFFLNCLVSSEFTFLYLIVCSLLNRTLSSKLSLF